MFGIFSLALAPCAWAFVAAPGRRLAGAPGRGVFGAAGVGAPKRVAGRVPVALEASEEPSATSRASVDFTETTACKALILFALVLQSAGVSLLARRACETCSYSGAAASVVQEALKLPLALAWLSGRGTPLAAQRRTLAETYGRPREMAVLLVPALCFAAQNVLFRAGKGCGIPNFKGSYLGRFPLASADSWTSDHRSERFRSVRVWFPWNTRADRPR